ncbi:hypothetical protein GCM10010388_28690 [Streptomyces mauvecolor]
MVIDAPSSLGLRPPAPGTVPGCYKLAGAMRERGIVRRLGAYEGGLLPDELGPLLRELVQSERCVGFNLTIYDPDLDPDGTAGALLADLVVGAFAQS